MNVFDNDKQFTCRVCKNIFCCKKCRINHETKHHTIILEEEIKWSCTICKGKPLLVRSELNEKLLKHIAEHHLPLHCSKCEKLYEEYDDLKGFTKCFRTSSLHDCEIEEDARKCLTTLPESEQEILEITPEILIKPIVVTKSVAQTQTSPIVDSKEDHKSTMAITSQPEVPIENTKCLGLNREALTDSASLLTNISSINSTALTSITAEITRSKGKLVRTTSTPLNAENFNAFDHGQVSSIHNSGSQFESSPAIPGAPIPAAAGGELMKVTSTPAKKIYGCRKIAPKTVMPLTPLRQVMSRSIKKAIARTTQVHSSPLDLRLSPALRRIQNETYNKKKMYPRRLVASDDSSDCIATPNLGGKEFLLSSRKLTTEAIVITRTKCTQHFESTSTTTEPNGIVGTSSVYKSCHSVEIITSTEENCENQKAIGCDNSTVEDIVEDVIAKTSKTYAQHRLGRFGGPLYPTANSLAPTPITSIPGAGLNKKLIKFETPNPETESTADIFFTPKATPPKNTNSRRSGIEKRLSLKECSRCSKFSGAEDLADDDVFLPAPTSTQRNNEQCIDNRNEGIGGLWSLMSAVMRLPSFTRRTMASTDSKNSEPTSLFKRCASIAGSLVRSKSAVEDDQLQGFKRKRTYSADNQAATQFNVRDPKRFRIQGRKPIERMRKNQ